MKHKVKFTGSNASGFVSYGNVIFPCGETVTVELSDEWLMRLDHHPEFEVQAVTATPAAAKKKKD